MLFDGECVGEDKGEVIDALSASAMSSVSNILSAAVSK
jgi:hypothetical protein